MPGADSSWPSTTRGIWSSRSRSATTVHYHPGGMDFDGAAMWIPCAEYRPDSTTTVYRLQPGGAPEPAFDVDDHVGAMARCGPDGDLVGWSWGSRRFYRWSVDGHLNAARVNPAFFVDHQDCQWLDSGHLLCGGVAEVGLTSGPGGSAGSACSTSTISCMRARGAVPDLLVGIGSGRDAQPAVVRGPQRPVDRAPPARRRDGHHPVVRHPARRDACSTADRRRTPRFVDAPRRRAAANASADDAHE